MSYLNEPLFIGRCVGRPSAEHRPIVARLKGNRLTIGRSSADHRPIVKFCDFLRYLEGFVFNVIASVGRQNDAYRPINIQKSYRPTVFLMLVCLFWLVLYVHGKQLRSCRDGQLSYPHCSWASLPEAAYQDLAHTISPLTDKCSS